MFGNFRESRLMSAIRGANQAANRTPAPIKYMLLLGTIAIIIRPDQAGLVIGNMLPILGGVAAVNFACDTFAGGMAGFFAHGNNEVHNQATQLPGADAVAPGF